MFNFLSRKKPFYRPKNGLYHYKNLFQRLKSISKKYYPISLSLFIEFSPAQKKGLFGLVKKFFPSIDKNKVLFYKDLAGKWRVMEMEIGPK